MLVEFCKYAISTQGTENSTHQSRKDELFFPKHSLCRTSALGRITLGSHITYNSLCSLLHTLLKDKYMCMQKWHGKTVSCSSCRTSAILKYFCSLVQKFHKLAHIYLCVILIMNAVAIKVYKSAKWP